MIEFKRYIDTNDIIPPGMTVVEWWGVRILCCSGLIVTETLFFIELNSPHYLIAASLAHDYLAIMASSVSSECAFSSAGITLSK